MKLKVGTIQTMVTTVELDKNHIMIAMKKSTLTYQTVKMFILFLGFFTLMGWLNSGEIYLPSILLFTFWMTGGIILPIAVTLLILKPISTKEKVPARLQAFKNNWMGVKLIGSLTVCIAIIFILLWLMVPLLGLTFWQAVAVSAGIGFVFACLCTLLIRYIIQLEEPPFQGWHEQTKHEN